MASKTTGKPKLKKGDVVSVISCEGEIEGGYAVVDPKIKFGLIMLVKDVGTEREEQLRVHPKRIVIK